MVFWESVITTGLATLAALGGVGLVAGTVAKFASDHASKRWLQAHKGELDTALESHKAKLSKETETHRLTLKRQELIYEREVEAAGAFMRLWRAIWPSYRMPGMDWRDACCDAAGELGRYEQVLEDFLEQHSIAISAPVRQKIDAARLEAATEKFFVGSETADPPESAVAAAGRMLDLLREAQEQVFEDLKR